MIALLAVAVVDLAAGSHGLQRCDRERLPLVAERPLRLTGAEVIQHVGVWSVVGRESKPHKEAARIDDSSKAASGALLLIASLNQIQSVTSCFGRSLGRVFGSLATYTNADVRTPFTNRPKFLLQTHILAHLNSASVAMLPSSGAILQIAS